MKPVPRHPRPDPAWLRRIKAWFMEWEHRIARFPRKVIDAIWVTVYSVREFQRDFGFERAATLSFATVLSLIPLVVLVFSFAGRFGGGDRIIEWIETKAFEFVAPDFHEDIRTWLRDNISATVFESGPAGIVNVTAVLALVIAALGLMTSAERIFNRIWKVRGHRSYFRRAAVFWLILTVSPLFIASSISMVEFIKSGWLEETMARHAFVRALYEYVVPFFVAVLGFTILYGFLPSARVRLRSAFVGGFVGAFLWSVSKGAFFIYASQATETSNFYGRLATVPLFLVWLFLSWALVIYGAEVSYVHQNLASLRKKARIPEHKHSKLLMALELLTRIDVALRENHPPQTLHEISNDLGIRNEDLQGVAAMLVRAGLLIEDADTPLRFVLAFSPELMRLDGLARQMVDGDFLAESEGRFAGSKDKDPTPASRRMGEAWGALIASFEDQTLASLRTDDGAWRDRVRSTVEPRPYPEGQGDAP